MSRHIRLYARSNVGFPFTPLCNTLPQLLFNSQSYCFCLHYTCILLQPQPRLVIWLWPPACIATSSSFSVTHWPLKIHICILRMQNISFFWQLFLNTSVIQDTNLSHCLCFCKITETQTVNKVSAYWQQHKGGGSGGSLTQKQFHLQLF